MSKVLEGQLCLVGKFIGDNRQDLTNDLTRGIPEITLGQCVLSLDGKTVCSGLVGADGIVFFTPCGPLAPGDKPRANEEYRKVFFNN